MTLIRHKTNLVNVTNFDLPDQIGTWPAKSNLVKLTNFK